MHPRERLFLAVAHRLQRKAARAAAYWGVRSAYLAGDTPFSALSDQDQAILKTKGNPAIRMNDLFKVSSAEMRIIQKRYPTRTRPDGREIPGLCRWAREIDYPKDMWWSDSTTATESRPPVLRENWNAARSLALAGEALDLDEPDLMHESEEEGILAHPSDYSEEDVEAAIRSRNQREREEIINLLESQRSDRGNDYWTETEYPVLESQASFSARGSNDDLDDLFGEEPRDDRGVNAARLEKLRQWQADRFEDFYESHGTEPFIDDKGRIHEVVTGSILESREILRHPDPNLIGPQIPEVRVIGGRVAPSGDFFGEDEKFEGHRFSTPLETDERGKPVRGGFVTRAMFFEERDRLLERLDSDYMCPAPKSVPFYKAGRLPKGVALANARGKKLAPPPLDLSVLRTAKPTHLNPAAPERPALKKGQRHVVIAHRSDGTVYECAPSY